MNTLNDKSAQILVNKVHYVIKKFTLITISQDLLRFRHSLSLWYAEWSEGRLAIGQGLFLQAVDKQLVLPKKPQHRRNIFVGKSIKQTCVRPASATTKVGIPRCSAVSFILFLIIHKWEKKVLHHNPANIVQRNIHPGRDMAYISCWFLHVRTILACPNCSHCLKRTRLLQRDISDESLMILDKQLLDTDTSNLARALGI